MEKKTKDKKKQRNGNCILPLDTEAKESGAELDCEDQLHVTLHSPCSGTISIDIRKLGANLEFWEGGKIYLFYPKEVKELQFGVKKLNGKMLVENEGYKWVKHIGAGSENG